jgi:hypothetical protein
VAITARAILRIMMFPFSLGVSRPRDWSLRGSVRSEAFVIGN